MFLVSLSCFRDSDLPSSHSHFSHFCLLIRKDYLHTDPACVLPVILSCGSLTRHSSLIHHSSHPPALSPYFCLYTYTTRLLTRRVVTANTAAANHGAHIVLHYLGDPKTTEDALIVQKQIERVDSNGEEKDRRKCVLVAGDISQEETAKKVSRTRRCCYGIAAQGMV